MSAIATRPRAGRTRATVPGLTRLSRWVARAAWLTAGASTLALAAGWAARDDLGPAPVLLFLVLPDLAFVAGIGVPGERGQLPARAVPLYNGAHRAVGPVALIALGLSGVLPTWWLAAGLAWLAHVALDRGLGFGLRTADGWQRV